MNEIFRFDEQSDLLAAHVFQEEIFYLFNTRKSNELAGWAVGVYGNVKEFA